MKLRYVEDIRTILWVLLAIALLAFHLFNPAFALVALPFACYFALACGVIAHNHNHCPIFESRSLNQIFSNVISIFYGYPAFAWIPTHNMNHHRYVNRPGDATITWRYSNRHNAFVAVTYFFISSYWQGQPIREFIVKAKEKNHKVYQQIMLQYAVFISAHLGFLATGIVLYGWRGGLYIYAMALFVPSFFALWTIMLFNYEQHVHTDPWSKHNHSRSWDGRSLNFFLFNNGFHAAHHEAPGVHWSRLKDMHEKLVPKIDPRLVHRGIFGYFFRQYVLAFIFPEVGTVQVGRAPFDVADGANHHIVTASVDVAEAGTNVEMMSG